MKKFMSVLLMLTMVLSLMAISSSAEETLPSYTWDDANFGADDTAPFGYKYIVKETGEVKDMVFSPAGTANKYGDAALYVPSLNVEEQGAYDYLYISATDTHPAVNAMPTFAFTAPHSGKVTISYNHNLWCGHWMNWNATLSLHIYKNSTDNLLETRGVGHEQDGAKIYTIDVEVTEGDVILFAIDAGDSNGGDASDFFFVGATYTELTPENEGDNNQGEGEGEGAPATADFMTGSIVLAVVALTAGVVASKKRFGR